MHVIDSSGRHDAVDVESTQPSDDLTAATPQQASGPADRSAHVYVEPALTCTASASPDAVTGTLELMTVPSPSFALLLLPQQATDPLVRTTQA